jgi:multiple sugar transport system permease protein
MSDYISDRISKSRAASAAQSGRRMRWRKMLRAAGLYLVLSAGVVVFALPFFWLVTTSVKPTRQLFQWPPVWIPDPIIWGNYPAVFDYAPFLLYLRNTMIIALPNVLGAVIVSSLAAYAFARIPAPGRGPVFALMLSTMMVPSIVTLVPLYVLFSKLHWVNTFLPLVIPPLLGTPFYIFLLRQFFLSLPIELEEAALLDGASYLRIWWSIMLPLSAPALATVGIFSFMFAWNDFFGPLIYLNNPGLYTLSLGLQAFQTAQGAEWGLLMAASTMMIAPIILLFFVAQRQFVQGIAITGIK